MLRITAASLALAITTVVGVTTASATTINDPIVRTRGGGTGSYQIFALPYFFDFGAFPTDPDTLPSNTGQGDNCFVGTDVDTSLPMVSCEFQNLTGQNISQLDFSFNIPGGGGDLEFTADPDNVSWTVFTADQFGAHFAGEGLPSGGCEFESCFGGDFVIEVIGFPPGSNITMLASTAVPEPASLLLLGTGLGLGAAFISRRKRSH